MLGRAKNPHLKFTIPTQVTSSLIKIQPIALSALAFKTLTVLMGSLTILSPVGKLKIVSCQVDLTDQPLLRKIESPVRAVCLS